jgi:hypothetical protein
VSRRLLPLLATLLVLLSLAGCAKKAAPPTTAAPSPFDEKPPDDTPERSSLVNLARGSTVVARSGEAILELSALRAADGDPGSFWQTPPGDVPQSVTLAFPARSRIDRVGVRTARKFSSVHRVSFEISSDGAAFRPLATITAAESPDPQWFSVTPETTSFLRVTMIDRSVAGRDPRLYSILARGVELEPPRIGRLDGAWTVNGNRAAFLQRGGHVFGVLNLGKQPIGFEGGSDGRIYRLAWVRGNDYGLAAAGVSPDSQHFSAIEWHEEAIPLFYGDSWFGERFHAAAAESPPLRVPDINAVAVAHLRRAGRFPLFGLRFDGAGALQADSEDALQALVRLLAAAPVPLRIVAHQFRESSDAKNLAWSQRELASLRAALAARGANLSRVELAAVGSANPRQKPVTELQRAMYSSIDLEIQR